MEKENRFLKLLEEKGLDKRPYIPCMDQYVQSGLPSQYQNKHVIDMQMELGTDMLRGVVAYAEEYGPDIKYEKITSGNDVIEKYQTPVGNLQQTSRFVPESPFIPFPVEYLVKTVEDLPVLRYLAENTIVKASYDDVEFYKNKYPKKIISASLSDSPFYDLLTKIVGVENFTYFYMDDPNELILTMEKLQEKKEKHLEVSAQSPADVLVIYENTNTSNSMPDWINEYAFTSLNRFADIAHKYDKPLLIHMCGKINLVLEDIAKCRFDGIIDVAPEPSGDCDFPRAIKLMEESNKIIAGGIECNQYTKSDNEQFRNSVMDFIKTLPQSRYYLLGSGDAVPQGATEDNLVSAYEISKTI